MTDPGRAERGSRPGILPFSGKPLRRLELVEMSDELAPSQEVLGQEENGDDVLIPDPRARLRPSEHVERKLSAVLGDAMLPISFLRGSPLLRR